MPAGGELSAKLSRIRRRGMVGTTSSKDLAKVGPAFQLPALSFASTARTRQ
jgi:hypothetical protein